MTCFCCTKLQRFMICSYSCMMMLKNWEQILRK